MSQVPSSTLVTQAAQLSIANQAALMATARCGCYSCGLLFEPAAIREWIADADGQTAMCPRCGVDAVIPETAETGELTDALLADAHTAWFSVKKDVPHDTHTA